MDNYFHFRGTADHRLADPSNKLELRRMLKGNENEKDQRPVWIWQYYAKGD